MFLSASVLFSGSAVQQSLEINSLLIVTRTQPTLPFPEHCVLTSRLKRTLTHIGKLEWGGFESSLAKILFIGFAVMQSC